MGRRIGVIPGDGIGPEVIAEAVAVLKTACEAHGPELDFETFPYGAGHYLKTGELLPQDGLERLGEMDALLLGAVGDPRVPPGVVERGVLLALRFHFDQYVNLRPVHLFPGVPCPLRQVPAGGFSFEVVRENTEDFYMGLGARLRGRKDQATLRARRALYELQLAVGLESSHAHEIAIELGVLTRPGIERIAEYACDRAQTRGKRLTAVDKANVLTEGYGLWREVVAEVAASRGIALEFGLVDAVAMQFVRQPERFSVVLAPNMFGDILTDLGAAIQGGMGMAPAGNINPKGGVSMFEPVHGSAPDIAGTGKANPLGAILAAEMLLDHLGAPAPARAIGEGVAQVLRKGKHLPFDLGGSASTQEVGRAVIRAIRQTSP